MGASRAPTGRLAAEGGQLGLAGPAIEADGWGGRIGPPAVAGEMLKGLGRTFGCRQQGHGLHGELGRELAAALRPAGEAGNAGEILVALVAVQLGVRPLRLGDLRVIEFTGPAGAVDEARDQPLHEEPQPDLAHVVGEWADEMGEAAPGAGPDGNDIDLVEAESVRDTVRFVLGRAQLAGALQGPGRTRL